jgi:hypothetical protein
VSIVLCQLVIVRDRVRSLNRFLRKERNDHIPGFIRSVLNISEVCESNITPMPVRVYYLQVTVIRDCRSRAFLLRAKKSQYQHQPVYRTHRSPSSSPLKNEITYTKEGGQEFGICGHTHVIFLFGQPRIISSFPFFCNVHILPSEGWMAHAIPWYEEERTVFGSPLTLGLLLCRKSSSSQFLSRFRMKKYIVNSKGTPTLSKPYLTRFIDLPIQITCLQRQLQAASRKRVT